MTVFFCACSLCGCFWQYKLVRTEEFAVGYRKKDAFYAAYFWNGDPDTMTFTVPDEYKGRTVTALGGYSGKGYPCPFHVEDHAHEHDWASDTAWGDDTYETLVFTVRLGEHIKKIYASCTRYIGTELPRDDGTADYDVLYEILYRFEVHADNKTFYAQDGKLYRKKDNSLVDEFFYG